MSELDDKIRQGLQEAAELPDVSDVDSVVNAIKAKADVAAASGNAGSMSLASTARTAGGSWLLWGGAGAVAALVAGSLAFASASGDGAPSSSQASASWTVSFRECPGGVAIGEFRRNDRVYAISRDASGWIGVRNPTRLSQTVWVPQDALTLDRDVAELETVTSPACTSVAVGEPTPETTDTTPTTVPESTTTTTSAPSVSTTSAVNTPTSTTPSAVTTTPTTAPTTTTTLPDATPPVVTNLARTPSTIYENLPGQGCLAGVPITSSVTVVASDAQSGISNVTMAWEIRVNGTLVPGGTGSKNMSATGGGGYQATLGAFGDILPGTSVGGVITVTVIAVNGRQLSTQASTNVTIGDCTFG